MRGQARLIAAVVVAVGLGAGAVAFGVALLLGHIVQLRTSANATLRTDAYLTATIDLERTVVDAETGLRGYVITAEPQFLAPTRQAQAQFPQDAATLERAAISEGAFVAQATALVNSARSYMFTYVPRVTRQVVTDRAAAQSLATTTSGKKLVDGIRAQSEQLQRLISAREAARQHAATNSANNAESVAIVVLIVLTALTIVLAGLLGWLLVGRERARERAAFLAESGALLDRGTTADEVLATFVKLVLERGNLYCEAAELAVPDASVPDRDVGRVVSGDATVVAPGDRPQLEAAWERARLAAQSRGAAATDSVFVTSPNGNVHVLVLAAMARRSLVARVLVARRGRSWRRDEVQEIEGLGARLALAIQARALQTRTEALYRRSDHIARTLQQSLLPDVLPDVPSCELAVRFAPAGEGELVGGDFYDVFDVGDGHWAIVIGDVCGKGPGAAAVTAMARWTLRSFAGAPRAPADALRSLNESMLRQDLDGRFITVAYALLSPRAGELHVTVACAGHPPAIVVSEDGEPVRLDAHGDLLGIWPQIRLKQVELRLTAGESLVLYTDGVTDQGPATERSPEHVLRELTVEPTARALADALRTEAERATPVPRDDVAIVALRYMPTGAGHAVPARSERHGVVPA